jgi:DNA-binding CsgD family transcriptional regulator/tetratricopeptide (TPR) repeat protein
LATVQAFRWPLVGRGRDVDEFEDVLVRGDVRAWVLAGPAGIGKTRLAREFLARAAEAGHMTATVSASASASTVPLSAMAALVPSAALDREPAELFSMVKDVVAEQRGERRFVLFVDDVDQLDAASLGLVSSLVDAEEAFLVATLREDAVTPDVVTRWWSAGDGLRRDLGALSAVQIDALLHLALEAPVSAAASRALQQASGGNPLYLRELVLTAVESGTLVDHDGVWTIAGPLEASTGLAALVESRLAGLSDEERGIVELLALCQPLGLDELAGVVSLTALEQLEARSLVGVERKERREEVSLMHPTHVAVIRRSIPRLRARTILLDAVERVEARGARRRDDVLRLAVWRLDATGTADQDLLIRAARLARHSHDTLQVQRLARAALVLEPNPTASALLAEAFADSGDPEAAEAAYAEAAQGLTGAESATLALPRATNAYFGLSRIDDAISILDEASAIVPGNAPEAAELAMTRAAIVGVAGRCAEAAELFDRFPTDDQRLIVMSSWARVAVLAQAGRASEAVQASLAGEAAHLALEDRSGFAHPASHRVARARVELMVGRFDEAERLLASALEELIRDGADRQVPWAHLLRARAAILRGDAMAVIEHSQQAASSARAAGSELTQRLAQAARAHGLALAGRQSDALAVMKQLGDAPFHTDDVVRAQAWVEACGGNLATAREASRAAFVRARADQRLATAFVHAVDLLRFGEVAAATDIVELAPAIDGSLARAYEVAGKAIVARDPEALLAAADDLADTGSVLAAAELCATAAVLHRSQGDSRRAASAAARAASYAGRFPGTRTPGLIDLDAPEPLTAREREIAELASTGLSSKEIATCLVLSVRTVDNHLQRVYTKLGIPGRAELPEVFGREGSGSNVAPAKELDR